MYIKRLNSKKWYQFSMCIYDYYQDTSISTWTEKQLLITVFGYSFAVCLEPKIMYLKDFQSETAKYFGISDEQYNRILDNSRNKAPVGNKSPEWHNESLSFNGNTEPVQRNINDILKDS